MTREETKVIIRTMAALYPSFKPADLTDTVNAWAVMLKDKDYKMTQAALKWYAESDQSGFAPSIGQLVDRYRRLTEGDEPQAEEAWALVRRAIANSAYSARQEYARLPETIQKAVGSADVLRTWSQSELEDLGYIEAGFVKNYRAVLERKRDYAAAGEELQRLMTGKKQEALPDPEPKEPLRMPETVRVLAAERAAERMRR